MSATSCDGPLTAQAPVGDAGVTDTRGLGYAAAMSGDNYLRGVAGMLLSSVLFSIMALLIRSADQIDFFKTALYRFAVGAILLGTLALFRKIRLEFNNSPILFLRGFLGGVAVLLFYMSIVKVGIAKGTVLSFTYPIFSTIGGVILLKDRVRPVVWPLLVASMLGIALLVGLGASGWGNVWILLTLLGGVLGGLAIVCVKRLTSSDSGVSIYMSQCLFGFWIVALPANLNPTPMGWVGGVLLITIGLVAAAAQLLMNWSFVHVSIATGSLLGLLTPVFNVVFGIAIFGETMGALELIGTLLILASCVGIVLWGREKVALKAPAVRPI
jgi:drug/metabolite transporter (DMT)-like permease